MTSTMTSGGQWLHDGQHVGHGLAAVGEPRGFGPAVERSRRSLGIPRASLDLSREDVFVVAATGVFYMAGQPTLPNVFSSSRK